MAKYMPKGSLRGAPLAQAARGHDPPLGGAVEPPGRGVGPLRLPFGLYLVLAPKTLLSNPVMRFRPLFRRRSDSDLGIARRSCPGTLPEGGLTSGGLFITMIAFGMCRE